MKKLIILSFFLISCLANYSQFSIPGIALKNLSGMFKTGDTISVLGHDNLNDDLSYYYVRYGKKLIKVKSSKIDLIDNNISFWDALYFKYGSEYYCENPQITSSIKETNKRLDEYIMNAHRNSQIINDELLYEYLYKIIHQLIPYDYKKLGNYSTRILVINSLGETISSYPTGLIIVTKDFLLKQKGEKELANSLLKEITKFVINYYGAEDDIELSKNFNRAYKHAQDKKLEKFNESISDEMKASMYALLIESAWNKYTLLDYGVALTYLERFDNSSLTSNEIVLKSILYRKLYNSPAKNLEALDFLNKTITQDKENLIDLHIEKTIFLIRLEQYELAAQSLNTYMQGLIIMESKGKDVSDEKLKARSIQLLINDHLKKNPDSEL